MRSKYTARNAKCNAKLNNSNTKYNCAFAITFSILPNRQKLIIKKTKLQVQNKLFLFLCSIFLQFREKIKYCCCVVAEFQLMQLVGNKKGSSINTAPNLMMNLFIIFSFSLLEKAHSFCLQLKRYLTLVILTKS